MTNASTEAALQAALTASRARIRALEAHVTLLNASEDQIRRGAGALAHSAEVAALKAERDSIGLSLATAEKKIMLQERKQQQERSRRSALAQQVKRQNVALQRKEADQACSTLAQLSEASKPKSIIDFEAESVAVLQAECGHLRFSRQLLESELHHVEEETVRRLENQAEAYEETLSEALERAVRAEIQLAGELIASERTVVGEAQQRAESEAASREREIALGAHVSVLMKAREEERGRAAALEIELARLKDDAAARDASYAERMAGLHATIEQLQAECSSQVELAEIQARSRALEEMEAEVRKARSSSAMAAHASLLMRVGLLSVMRQKLHACLERWKLTVGLLVLASSASARREEVRALKAEVQGKLAAMREHRQRVEESSLAAAQKAEEAQNKKLQLAKRRLQVMEERRRCLERELSSLSDKAAAMESAAEPIHLARIQVERRNDDEVALISSELKQLELEHRRLTVELRRTSNASTAASRDGRRALLRVFFIARVAAALAVAWSRWRSVVQCGLLAEHLEEQLKLTASGWVASREESERELARAVSAAAERAAAIKLQAAARARALRAEVASFQAKAGEASASSWQREAALQSALSASQSQAAAARELLQRSGLELQQLRIELSLSEAECCALCSACEAARVSTVEGHSTHELTLAEYKAQTEVKLNAMSEAMVRQTESMGDEIKTVIAQAESDRVSLIEAMELVSSQRRSSILGHSCLLLQVCSRWRRQHRLLASMVHWRSNVALLCKHQEINAEIFVKANVKGTIALMKERQIRSAEAAARESAALEEDAKRELLALRRRVSSEIDRRTVLAGELRERTAQRDAAVRREMRGRGLLERVLKALQAERNQVNMEVAAANARAGEAEAARQEALMRNEELQRVLDGAAISRDQAEASTRSELQASQASVLRLRELVMQGQSEREATDEAVASHQEALAKAAMEAVALRRELVYMQAAHESEQRRANAAIQKLSHYRESLEQNQAALAAMKQQAAQSEADLQAANARLRVYSTA